MLSRQGSAGFIDKAEGEELSRKEKELQKLAREIYNERLEKGIAREQARKDLPLSTYTEAYWKIDLHNLLHFLELRMDAHAQLEIQRYANIIGEEIVAKWCPIAWEAFKDYRLNSIHLTRLEYEIIRQINSGNIQKAIQLAKEFGFIKEDGELKKNREREELEAKLIKLHFSIPWQI